MKTLITAFALALGLSAAGFAQFGDPWDPEPDPDPVLPGGGSGSGSGGAGGSGGSGGGGGETVIYVGTPGSTPVSGLNTASLSTSQIDPILTALGYGPNYTRDRASELFGDYDALIDELESAGRTALLGLSEVQSISYFEVEVDPLTATFRQSGNSIGLELGSMDVLFVGQVSTPIPFCGSATTYATISDVRIFADYNLYNGILTGRNATYNLGPVSASCGNPIGDLIVFLADLFGVTARSQLQDELADGIEVIQGYQVLQSTFSIEGLLDALDDFRSQQNLPQFADDALDVAQDIIQTTNINTGLQLELIIDPGSTQNQVGLIASHQPVDVIYLEATQNEYLPIFSQSANTASIQYYSCNSSVTSCHPVGNPNDPSYLPQIDQGRVVYAIGKNGFFTSLNSRPGRGAVAHWDFNCFSWEPDCREVY